MLGAVARARRVRAARAGRPDGGRGGLLAVAEARGVRVLGARGVHPAHRGLAVLRLAAASDRRARSALAQGLRGGLRAGSRPAARRGTADRDAARRREGGRPVVGLVGGEDRRRVAARHRAAVCVRRTGWRRIYDLPERVIPADLLGLEPTDDECLIHLVGTVSRALGVATHADFMEYQRLNGYGLQLRDAARLDGGRGGGRAGPGDGPRRQAAGRGLGRPGGARLAGRGRTRHAPHGAAFPVRLADLGQEAGAADVRLPAPVRALRAQGEARAGLLHHAAARRRPDRGLGRPGAGRQNPRGQERLPGRPAAVAPMARALTEAAQWVGCSNVVAERVQPAPLAQPLAAALQPKPAEGSS